jgi:hypothetical protein
MSTTLIVVELLIIGCQILVWLFLLVYNPHSSKRAGTSWARQRTAPTISGGFSKARTIHGCGGN